MQKRRLNTISDAVKAALETELEYIDNLSLTTKADTKDHGVEGQLLALKVYADRAVAAWVENAGSEEALHELRKCAGLSIRALELYGCPTR